MPDALAKPSAAGTPESGTPITMSASTVDWGEQLAHTSSRRVNLVTHEIRIGSGEVHELEDAELLLALGRVEQLLRRDAATRNRHHLSRCDLADEGGADDVQRR